MHRRDVLRITAASAASVLGAAVSRIGHAVKPGSGAGQWSAPIQMPIVAIHTILLPNGHLLLWQHGHEDQVDTNGNKYVVDNPMPHVWNPNAPLSSNNPRLVNVPTMFPNGYHTDEIYCSGHSFLPDGRLLVTGGHLSKWNTPPGERNSEFTGSLQTLTFDYTKAQPWALGPNMNAGRWYPTSLPLADGSVLVIGGIMADHPSTGWFPPNPYPQIYDPVANAYRTLTGAYWEMPTYPWMYADASGSRAFYAGPGPDTRLLQLSGQGQWGPPIQSAFGQSRSPGFVHRSSSVLYAPGNVMNVGGIPAYPGADEYALSPTDAAEVIDLNVGAPAWRQVASMNYPRQHLNSTLLPDGNVLVTGGTLYAGGSNVAGAVMAAEIWDPQSNSWSVMASMSEPRLHHATALLLPDARVLVGGGGETGFAGEISHTTFEIYSPPYLFQGSRPVIGPSTPSTIRYGQPFAIGTSDRIDRVVLIRLPSVTHGFNQNQAVAEPAFTRTRTELRVAAVDRNAAPPGHYMLFIVSNTSVPSVAKIVQVSN